MHRRRAMEHAITYVGLDVHKDTIAVAIAETGRLGEVREHGKIANTPTALKGLVSRLTRSGAILQFCRGLRLPARSRGLRNALQRSTFESSFTLLAHWGRSDDRLSPSAGAGRCAVGDRRVSARSSVTHLPPARIRFTALKSGR